MMIITIIVITLMMGRGEEEAGPTRNVAGRSLGG
jgi:hypothetical protein